MCTIESASPYSYYRITAAVAVAVAAVTASVCVNAIAAAVDSELSNFAPLSLLMLLLFVCFVALLLFQYPVYLEQSIAYHLGCHPVLGDDLNRFKWRSKQNRENEKSLATLLYCLHCVCVLISILLCL